MVAQYMGTGMLDITGGGEEHDGLGRRELKEVVHRT
jgi:hypothetical protein